MRKLLERIFLWRLPLPDPVPDALPPMARTRHLASVTLCMAIFVFHTYTALTGLRSATTQRSVHWCLVAALLFLVSAPSKNRLLKRLRNVVDSTCIVAIACATAYLTLAGDDLLSRIAPPMFPELFFGAVLIIITLEAARRSSGLVLPLTALIFLIYAMAGPYMPGLLKHKGYSLSRIISYLYSTSSGIYGIPLGVSSTYIILFVFFGSFLNASGAGKLLLDTSLSIVGRFTGGAAKTAVIASALMGTMSGSSIANAVTTGTITIPLMKESGFNKHMACAVEATASTGGMLMPPVMGAAAFVMAEYLRVDYATIMKAAFLPALVFFASIYFTIDFYSRKHKIGATLQKSGTAGETFRKSWHLIIPIVCLVTFLLLRKSPMTSVVYSLIILVAVSLFRRETRLTPEKCIAAIVDGAKNSITVASACATSGIILGVIGLTGIGSAFSSALFANFSSFLPAALIAAMVISLILGMGMPATAVYVILATLVAPSLERLGVTPLAAHMFVFYFGIISTITPPVALTAYAAAAVGGGNALRVSVKAFLLGVSSYAIPFVLVYAPEMMLTADIPSALLRFGVCIAAVYAISLFLIGFIRVQLTVPCRVLAGVAGLFLMTPNLNADLVGFLLLGLVLFMHSFRKA
ncbi:MAG: hypothetical protein DELT_00174 [Desulfovibrio sp.]